MRILFRWNRLLVDTCYLVERSTCLREWPWGRRWLKWWGHFGCTWESFYLCNRFLIQWMLLNHVISINREGVSIHLIYYSDTTCILCQCLWKAKWNRFRWWSLKRISTTWSRKFRQWYSEEWLCIVLFVWILLLILIVLDKLKKWLWFLWLVCDSRNREYL
jgi:hypothetical protein